MDTTYEDSQKGGETAVPVLLSIKVSKTWELVGIDLLGPLNPTSKGYTYILTATDYFSKWVYAYPMRTKSSAEVASNLASMIYEQGCPQRILSDQCSEFINMLNMDLCKRLEIDCSNTLVYRARQTQWMKKANQNIKRALSKVVNEKQDDWDCYLKPIVFSLRSKMHCTTKFSPFQIMYGREAVFPSELPPTYPLDQIVMVDEAEYVKRKEEVDLVRKKISDQVVENVAVARSKQKKSYAKRVLMKSDVKANKVLLQNKRKAGPSSPQTPPMDIDAPWSVIGYIQLSDCLQDEILS